MSDNHQTKNKSIIHKAKWIVIDPWTIIQDGYIRVENNIIQEIAHINTGIYENIKDYGSGVLIPGLINAHTHLELSSLKGKLFFDKGFKFWVQQLLQVRESMSNETLIKGAESGINELKNSGSTAIGEISTLGLTKKLFLNSGLQGIWFQEYLGHNLPDFSLDETINESFAGHAPHTTSPDVLKALKHASNKKNLPFSIHLDESQDERKFLTTAKGSWADFLIERGIEFSNWGLPAKSPVQYMEKLGILDKNTIAVHLIHTQQKEFELLKKYQVNICICPRSNHNLHKKLPDLESMLKTSIKPCLGTDSLASTQSLSMFDEMKFTASMFPNIGPKDIMAMATINGAKALGIQNYSGSLMPGKLALFIYLPITSTKSSNLLEKIIHETLF